MTFWSCRKAALFKIADITTWLANNCDTHIDHYLKKERQSVKKIEDISESIV